MQENQVAQKKTRQSSKRKIASIERRDPNMLMQFGGYVFPVGDVVRIEDRVKPLFDGDEQVGWTFFLILKNGDTLMWEVDYRDYEGQEALMDLHTQLESYAESLRIATMQIVWGRDAMIVKPEEFVYGDT